MPSSGHGINTRTKSTRQESGGGRRAGQRRLSGGSAKRQAIALELPANNSTPLSAVSDHLPSLSTINSLRAFLPHVSPPQGRSRAPESTERIAHDETRTAWQDIDLKDGQGKCRYLLVVSRMRGLQIWRFSSSELPRDVHVPESFPAPELVFHLARLPPSNGPEAEHFMLEARVLEGHVVPDGSPVLAVLSQSLPASRRDPTRSFALTVIGMRSGKSVQRFDLGEGRSASLRSSSRAIAVAVCGTVPELFLLDTKTLSFLPFPFADLALVNTSDSAAFDLSGRLLAYATSEPPRVLGPLGLGSIVCGPSVQRGQRSSPTRVSASASEQPRDASTALMTTAVQIGGGVARGLWAGISRGAKAAEQYRASRLARSAPSEGSGSMMEAGEAEAEHNNEDDVETRCLGESSPVEEPLVSDVRSPRALWVKVVDLGPSGSDRRPARTVAHFRLPPSQAFFSPANIHSPIPQTRSEAGTPISRLSFSPDGTQLLVAQADGRSFHVVSIDPSIPHQHKDGDSLHGQVRHLYELKRGNTPSDAREVVWDKHGRWVGVGTARGTIHVWPIHPLGCVADTTTHARPSFMNPSGGGALSTVVSPIQRLRVSAGQVGLQAEQAEFRLDLARAFAFVDFRSDPVDHNRVYQDMIIVQPSTGVVHVLRLILGLQEGTASRDHSAEAGGQRGSALSETIRAHRTKQPSALSMRNVTLAKWLLDTGDDEGDILLEAGEYLALASTPSGNSVAQAELQTHSTNPRVLPASIYLSKQVEFFAARAIDEYSPLSIMDTEARTRRLVFRSEVQVRPVSESSSTTLDAPLQHALHEVIDECPEAQIPGLPNGYTRGTKWTEALPIKQVAAGLGGGVDLVRREYARAQRSRSTRRESRAAANALSFEDDSVLAVSAEDQAGSVPSSEDAPVPMTDDGSASGAEGDESEWRDQWEEEYRRAVEDDGGPDDLVLGLLDEEQEKWEARRKVLAGQYAPTITNNNNNNHSSNSNNTNTKNTNNIKTSGTRSNKKK